MTKEDFTQKMAQMRPYLSIIKMSEDLGYTAATLHNYMNGRCPDELKRILIYTSAKLQLQDLKSQLLKIGI